jgi:hypothetical protein
LTPGPASRYRRDAEPGTATAAASSRLGERLEDFVREQIRRVIQAVVEEEGTALFDRHA